MKVKITAGILLIMFLVGTMVSVLPTKAAFVGTIKVGVIGPVGLPHWSPAGMKPAAEMARDEINAAGGVHLPDGDYEIVLAFGDEHAYPTPDPGAAAAEMERLINVEGAQFIIGGFRTECTQAMIPVAMSYRIPYLIVGSSTTELISDTVAVDYETYKYLFRSTPPNSTFLVMTIMAYLGYYLIPYKLLPLYGYVHEGMTYPQVDVAVVVEDLKWTELIYYYLTTPAIYRTMLGPYANVTYGGRIPDGTLDTTPWLQGVKDSKARLMIHIFSGTTGVPLIMQWKDMGVKALPLGINVMAQLESHWTTTEERSEFEAFLDFSGTRTPIVPGVTEVFWDGFVDYTDQSPEYAKSWPIYTAFGVYSALYILKDAIERAGTLDPGDGHGAPGVITALETTDAKAGDPGMIVGNFKFTADHDVYSDEPGPIWTKGYVRPFVVQWQAGRKEVVGPIGMPYTRKCALPNTLALPDRWDMYPYPTDVTQDTIIDGDDIVKSARAYGSTPDDSWWRFLADVDRNRIVDMADLASVSYDYRSPFRKVAVPLAYCDEYGKWE